MNNIYFTSDTHFNHANIIKYCDRPFKSGLHMDEHLIEEWNKVVPEGSTVWHLGDFAMAGRGAKDYVQSIFDQLNGQINFIIGNHDKAAMLREWTKYRVEPFTEIKYNKQRMTLSHYSMRVWNKSHHGAWCLYGHSHNNLEHLPLGKSMDVGVDTAAALGLGYRPFHFDEIKEILDKRSVYAPDHHGNATK